jgi:uncharacterized protein YbcI
MTCKQVPKLDEIQCMQLQVEFKIYLEKYFKQKLGQGIESSKVIIGEDMVFIRGNGFLTEPEKYIAKTTSGREVVNNSRMQVARQHSIDNLPYFESRLGARAIHHIYTVEAENDFWMHIIVFDRVLF